MKLYAQKKFRTVLHAALFCGLIALAVVVQPVVQPQHVAYAAPITFPDVAFPDDAGLINVKTVYNAVGDGVTDDTLALQQAIAENVGMHRTLFFPAGTYLVKNGFDWKNSAGQWRSYLTLQGAGADATTIRLADSTAGFGDTSAPKAVLRSGSKTDDPACSNYGQDSGDGGGNCGFENYLFDLTVDTGNGNPGAIGIDYNASNNGSIENVRVRSGDGAGVTGISLRRAVGPAMLKHIEVLGFQTGINAESDLYSITLEDLYLQGQSIVGLRNAYNTLAVRKLVSSNSVPAVINDADLGLIVLTDATLEDGGSTSNAIINRGTFLARNISTTGYGAAIQNGDAVVPGTQITEWLSHPARELFPSPDHTLGLEVRETPEYYNNDLSTWANVTSYGAVANDGNDDAAAIQAAIDSGKSTIYLPAGDYTVNTTLVLRGNVQRVIGFMSDVNGSANPIWRSGASSANSIILERLRTRIIEHASANTLAVRHIGGSTLTTVSGCGPLFIDDVVTDLNLHGGQVWARQLNAEGGFATGVTNSGAQLWILGMKSEGTITTILTQDGGKTELLGGLIYALGGDGSAAYVNNDSSVSLSFSEISYGEQLNFENYVQETRAGETKTLPRSEAIWRGYGGMMPLYTGYESSDQLAGRYKLVSRQSGQVLDDYGFGGAGTWQVQWPDNGGANQQWDVSAVGSNYKLTSVYNGLALDVERASTSQGAHIVLQPYTGASSQLWSITDLGSGYYRLTNQHSGMTLDVSGASNADGASIIQWPSHNGNNQQWQLIHTVSP